MESILEIIKGVNPVRLTTLARVKRELKITSTADDDVLQRKIEEASSDIQGAMGYRLPSEDVKETFWHSNAGEIFHSFRGWDAHPSGRDDVLFLKRTPIRAISKVTVDDDVIFDALDPSTAASIRFDAGAGLLYRVGTSGYPCPWWFCKSIVTEYTGGFILPGSDDCDLEPGIEGATIALLQSYWASRGRDALIKREDIPDVRTVEYWVGAVGDPKLLPPRVLASLSQFERPAYA